MTDQKNPEDRVEPTFDMPSEPPESNFAPKVRATGAVARATPSRDNSLLTGAAPP